METQILTKKINLCLDLFQQGKLDQALTGFLELLEIYRQNPLIYYNIGIIYKMKKDWLKAIDCFQKAITFDKKLIFGYYHLALCYREIKEFSQAIDLIKVGLKIDPKNYLLLQALGNLLSEINRLKEAIAVYQQALKLRNDDSRLFFNLGLAYFKNNDLDQAEKNFLSALKLKPKASEVFMMLGHTCQKKYQFKKAVDYYQQVIGIDPDFDLAYSSLFIAKRRICDWRGMKKIDNFLNKTYNQDPWGALVRTSDLKTILLTAKSWSQRIEKEIEKTAFTFKKNPGKKKIRVGYLSLNFGDHPVGHFCLDLFSAHNREKFLVYAFSYGQNDGSVYRKKLEKTADFFIDLNNFNDHQASEVIYQNNIDILVDLTGWTEGNRLGICARRPAPIQVNWSEYLGTSGSSFFDYLITDKILTPPSFQPYFTEKFVYLPTNSYWRKIDLSFPKKNFSRKDFSLPENQFVFGCFHQVYKINPLTWASWIRILKALPKSVLWLWGQDEVAVNNLCMMAEKAGVDRKRLIFAPTLSQADFYHRLKLADLALDTFTYGGGVISFLTLAAGVPLLTLIGNHIPSRVSASLIAQLGLTKELVVRSPLDYEKKAIDMVNNSVKLRKIRKKISYLKPEKKFFQPQKVVSLEKAYLMMVDFYQKNQPPKQIIIE